MSGASFAVSGNTITNAPYLQTDGLTLLSEEGERATLHFLNPTGDGNTWGFILNAHYITLSNLTLKTSERAVLVASSAATNTSFYHVD